MRQQLPQTWADDGLTIPPYAARWKRWPLAREIAAAMAAALTLVAVVVSCLYFIPLERF